MGIKTTILLACLAVPAIAPAKNTTPQDVRAFIRNADACEHFAEEFDGGSEKRQREVERSVVKHCQAAQKQLEQLSAKYIRLPVFDELDWRPADVKRPGMNRAFCMLAC
ncbi:hypothetical protein [Massilia sp. Root418]|uniref:hypothetical protein n=1 Tax=Massilia sp. Root418 TaxID=1736532 RepID=UPI0006F88F4C|nr:hypothetical protein [Massilia sp. Root418]